MPRSRPGRRPGRRPEPRSAPGRAACLLLTALFVGALLLPQGARAAEGAARRLLERLRPEEEALPVMAAAPVLALPEETGDPNSAILGGFCQEDGTRLLYYGPDWQLYAETGAGRERLTLAGTALFPLPTEEALYYVAYDGEGASIRRLPWGADRAEELYASREELSFPRLGEGRLWFFEGERLRCLEADGSCRTLARGQQPRDLGLTEAGPSWIDDRGLWLLSEGEPRLLLEGCRSWQPRAGLWYCADGAAVTVLNRLGEVLFRYELPCLSLSLAGDRLYYATEEGVGCLDLPQGEPRMLIEGLTGAPQRLTVLPRQGGDLCWFLLQEGETPRMYLAFEAETWLPRELSPE